MKWQGREESKNIEDRRPVDSDAPEIKLPCLDCEDGPKYTKTDAPVPRAKPAVNTGSKREYPKAKAFRKGGKVKC